MVYFPSEIEVDISLGLPEHLYNYEWTQTILSLLYRLGVTSNIQLRIIHYMSQRPEMFLLSYIPVVNIF